MVFRETYIEVRSIPAWAGETVTNDRVADTIKVYPRVGGGNQDGSGGHCAQGGLSPRGRGKHSGGPPIPPASAVYPRVGGGNSMAQLMSRCDGGLSPRGRGKRKGLGSQAGRSRSIPAWAGETARRTRRAGMESVYPRVGGGNRRFGLLASSGTGLSPRGRGKPGYRNSQWLYRGSIPAWAGETPPERRSIASTAVYPRVGGGNR